MSKITSILLGTDNTQETPRIFTGLPTVDKSTGGLRGGNTYLLAGLEKSGKTSLLINWISHNLEQNKKITFISTEMSLEEVVTRIATIRGLEISFDNNPERGKLNAQLNENLTFFSADDLVVGGEGLSVKQTVGLAEKSIWDGADLVIVDNLTTFAAQTSDHQPSWFKVAEAITKLVNLAKFSVVPIIIVLHIKPNTTFKDNPDGLSKIAKSENPLSIFDDSLTVIKRPSLSDVYGGGGALSQVSGAILLWRPYQKFSKSIYSGDAALILDSMRHSESGVDVRVKYDGKSGKFTETTKIEDMSEDKILSMFD